MALIEELSVGRLVVEGGGSVGTVASVAGLSVYHKQSGIVNQTVFTLDNVAQAVVNGTEYQGTKLFDFPAGRIQILGAIATIAQKTTSVLASTLNASVTGAVAVGSAAASNVSLTSTMVNIIPSTAFTSSATINVAGTAVSAPLGATTQLDGTSTAVPVYINTAYATTGDVDADATQTLTGTITITWINLGEY
jgi:hypothetical protein